MCARACRHQKEGLGFSGTEVRGSYEPPCEYQELNTGPAQSLKEDKGLSDRQNWASLHGLIFT